MKNILYLLILSSIFFPSHLKKWIDDNSILIDKNLYKLRFEYLVSKNKQDIDSSFFQTIEFYSTDTESSITKFKNRLTISYKDYVEIIDLSSKQKVIQYPDTELNDFKSKLVSIFKDKDFKIIKLSKNKYLLSLNNFYINMNITYNKNNPNISELRFYQAPYWIYIQDLAITSLDSLPYDYTEWDNYEVFDFR